MFNFYLIVIIFYQGMVLCDIYDDAVWDYLADETANPVKVANWVAGNEK